jgi:hypothetical protein
VLVWGAALLGALVLLIAGGLYFAYVTADVSTVGELRFETELRIPPLEPP